MKYKQTSGYFYFYLSLVILVLSLLLVQSTFAGSVAKLYESSIKVDSTKEGKEQAENQLIAKAFTHVLIKVSGRSDVTRSPVYGDLLKKADSAISQFRYDYKDVLNEDEQTPAENGVKQENQPIAKEKWFWVRFNAKAINDLLKEAQIPIWGKIRPETLIWFSQEIKGKRYLQGQYDEPEIYHTFKQQAEQRGIALIFPFLDLQDQSSVSTTDIWGNFNDAVLLASRRYQAQSTLTSRLFKEPSGLWVSQWNLLMLGEVQSWEIRNEKLEKVLISGIDGLADKLSRQFTQVIRDESDSGVIIQVNNVNGYKAFQALDDYLRNLATVKSVTLMAVEKDKIVYSINYLSSKNSLIQEIRLGDLLNSVERSNVVDEQSNANGDDSYKPVILDDLAQSNTAKKDSIEIETAADTTLANKDGVNKDGANKDAADKDVVDKYRTQEKIVQALVPELEYWLER